MTDLRPARPWWNRRDFLKTGAATAASAYAMRWGLETARENVVVAGAWTRSPWPATMEAAVASGRAAGRALRREKVTA